MKNFFYTFLVVLFFNCGTTKAQNYKAHKVKQGETIEAIAKTYNVTVYDIYRLNPDAKGNIRPNVVLLIPKSKITAAPDKVVLDKEIEGFKRHKVKRKETLYSLSKRYGIFVEDIKKHNPFLYQDNLKRGDILKIPVYKRVKRVVKAQTKKYIVKPQEGKWRIAYSHGISVPELEALNPDMGAVLKAGQIITVPNLGDDALQTVNEAQYSYYTVLPKEGFYRLKVKLGVEQEQLEALNPSLKTEGLKEGMVLKVPLSSKFAMGMHSVANDSLLLPVLEIPSVDLSKAPILPESKHIAIMLPFKANSVVVEDKKEAKKKINKDPFMSRSLDFYSGVILALDKLKQVGVNLQVDVFDTENKESKVLDILASLDPQSLDAVIGPLMPKSFNKVASALQQYNTPIVSPITKKVNMGRNVFQSRPQEALLQDKLIAYFSKDTVNQHVIIISDTKHQETSKKLKQHFPNAEIVNSKKDSKSDKDKYYIIDEDLVELLKPGKNVVFLETQNAGFISNVSSILNSLITDDVKVTLTTTNMNKAYESEEVSNNHLSNLQFLFPTIAKVNDDDKSTFVKRYKKEYGVTPNTFAVRGYDLMLDVGLRIATSENLYTSITDAPLTSYEENKFGYQQTGMGYQNNAVYLVKYNDLKIVEVKD